MSLTLSCIDVDWELHRWCPFVKPFPAMYAFNNVELMLNQHPHPLLNLGGAKKTLSFSLTILFIGDCFRISELVISALAGGHKYPHFMI